MKLCLQLDELPFTVRVEQNERSKRFRVTYGRQVKIDLTYVEAAHELGECVFHALAAEGKLDNEGP